MYHEFAKYSFCGKNVHDTAVYRGIFSFACMGCRCVCFGGVHRFFGRLHCQKIQYGNGFGQVAGSDGGQSFGNCCAVLRGWHKSVAVRNGRKCVVNIPYLLCNGDYRKRTVYKRRPYDCRIKGNCGASKRLRKNQNDFSGRKFASFGFLQNRGKICPYIHGKLVAIGRKIHLHCCKCFVCRCDIAHDCFRCDLPRAKQKSVF